MLIKRKFKWLVSLTAIPCLVGFSLSAVGCSKNQEDNAIHIVDPENKHAEDDVDSEGRADVIFFGFSYKNIQDETKLSVSGTFISEQATFEYTITSFDIYSKTFSVRISMTNIAPSDNIKGKLLFTYDGQPIIQEKQSEFTISILPCKKIYLPTQTEQETQISDGEAEIRFPLFKSEGIDDTSKLIVNFLGQPTFGTVSCSATKQTEIDNYFAVIVSFEDVLAETVVGSFEFYYGSTKIEVEPTLFSCKLTRDNTKPKFEEDDWHDINWLATDGLETLQKYYGVVSFVGLKRYIKMEDKGGNSRDYPVTVIGQNHDHYESGKPVALTFQFDNVISIQNDTDYVLDEQPWSEDDTVDWWYDPEEQKTECSLRKYLREEVAKRIELNVRGFFKPVVKTTSKDVGGDEPKLIESKDAIWCASWSEVGFTSFDEGKCYEYYKDCLGEAQSELRIATDITNNQPQTWWCRTPFGFCDDKGSKGSTSGHTFTIRPCFCI